ncbi:nitroreductase family deazaflavin-dependent oxidoreductase [Agrococcus sp. HG114]|uniref:nitroreductase family deazaflavin-dependent oxidoreductase n=1 Tax=Agrococcus sp. HG114 TaxID=2969757 RepID=UPI00215A6CB1|nr:nitroreductase family deazaflavin-dependent oxidoreductase [Agrococcus sp. HG114]MCR8669838.1 nitroreductase family deazaflavin-dependent oxidoreductase [Agrococcus sp. HG114]
MSTLESKPPKTPPRWFIRAAWVVHRALYRVTGGRFGLRTPRPGTWGMLRLHTIGRRSGEERIAILSYFEDGPNLVTIAMNGWMEGHPAWLLNLRAHPDASVDLQGERRAVRAREAQGAERQRLWDAYGRFQSGPSLDEFQRARPLAAPIVVLEPR